MKRCVIIGAVEIDFPVEKLISPTDFVICADRGWLNAKKHGVEPNMIVGDFDSSEMPQNPAIPVTILPVVKDDTDTYHIAKYVVENGFTDVLMCGVLGGKRVEHTFANLQTLLYLARHRINATMMDKYSQLIAIENGKISLPPMENKFFSLFSLGDKCEGVSIKGAFYALDNATLTNDYPIGVSNEFAGNPVEIEVREGSLLIVITEKD